MKLRPTQLGVSAVVTATPGSGHSASPASEGCGSARRGAALCSGSGSGRRSRGAPGRGGWGSTVAVLHSPKQRPRQRLGSSQHALSRAAPHPRLLMNLGARQRTGDNPSGFPRDRDEKRAAEGIW